MAYCRHVWDDNEMFLMLNTYIKHQMSSTDIDLDLPDHVKRALRDSLLSCDRITASKKQFNEALVLENNGYLILVLQYLSFIKLFLQCCYSLSLSERFICYILAFQHIRAATHQDYHTRKPSNGIRRKSI